MAMPHQTELNADVEENKMKKDLFKYAMRREWAKVVRMYEKEIEAHSCIITKSKDTALHVAVSDGQEDNVEKLVNCLVKSRNTAALEKKNEDGNTPLHLAAAIGSVKMCLVIGKEDNRLVEIRNNEGETPFFLAASCGNKNAFLHLHSLRNVTDNPDPYTNCRRKDGETILHCAIDGEYLDLAYQIINLYEDLVKYNNKRGLSPLHYLAMKPSVFRSGCHIRRFNKIIYHCTFVDELTKESQKEPEKAVTSEVESNCPDTYKSCLQFCQLLRDAIYGVISNIKQSKSNSPDEEAPTGDGQRAEHNRLVPDNYVTCFDFAKLVAKAMLIILGLGWRDINKMQHKKEKHTWSLQIMNQLVKLTSEYDSTGGDPREAEGKEEHEVTSPYFYHPGESSARLANADGKQPGTKSEVMKKMDTPLLLAAKNGVVEMVEEILKRFPVAINDTNEDKKNAVLLAVENRQPQVYKLLLDRGFLKDVVFRKVDKEGNGALHLAANLVGSNSPWTIPGAALQMQWEIKWYEYIRDSKPVHYFPRHNKYGESPREIFTKTHRDLLKSGGEWLTKTSQSCSLVAALVATVAFATAATVPGGNDQLKGTPLLKNSPPFDVFAIGSLFALGFAITSLVMFLAILTSRYQENDFRTSLPWKLLLGLTSLFMSIGAMLVSFCAGHFFVLKDNLKYAAFPIYALTCLPVSFFATAQFPLYFDLMRATFMEVPLRSYTVVPDSTQWKPADDNKDEDTTKEIIKLLKNQLDLMRATFKEVPLTSYTVVPDSTQRKPVDDNKDEDTAKEIIKLLKNRPSYS